MIDLLKTYILTLSFIFIVLFGSATNGYGFQTSQTDIANLRRAFIEQFSPEFEFIKGELKTHTVDAEKQSYWLAHVKPKCSGFFTIKYSYQYADKFYAEGENEMKIGVGGESCTRYPKVVRDVGYFCLVDTIIVPIRLDKRSKHVFTLESKYAKAEDMEESRKQYNSFLNRLDTEKMANPLAPNLKYLGKFRTDELFRSGGGNVSHHAVFEADNIGRFNLEVGNNVYDSDVKTSNFYPVRAIPILIVAPGKPVTSLVPEEKITYYTKKRAYSSDYKNSYESTFLILQPGDEFTIKFLAYTERPFWYKKDNLILNQEKLIAKNPNPSPIFKRQPFALPIENTYNEWIRDYLPD